VNAYIKLYYEPLDEDYDEARYFTKEFDKSLLKKTRIRRHKKIVGIELK
jgi:hypothetical protein